MRNYIFLYREKNTDDRDCCAYINKVTFDCDHYFSAIRRHGACYSCSLEASYEEIETFLTKEEYDHLIKVNQDIEDLGYGIKKGDDRYNKGIELIKKVQPIYDRLLSAEAQAYFEKIQKTEKNYIEKEFGLNEKDVEYIFDNYGLDYRDRAIVGAVFDNPEELGREEAVSLGYVRWDDTSSPLYRFFNYEAFGTALLEDDGYLELPSGRIVTLNY